MMLLFIPHLAKATVIYVRNSTNQTVYYYALCPTKLGPYTCNKKIIDKNEIVKYSASGLCAPCAMKVAVYTEDAKNKLCDTGDAVYFKLMMVSIKQDGDKFSCEKSVDPEGVEKLFP